MTQQSQSPFTDASAPMTPDNQRNEPVDQPFRSFADVASDTDLPARVPGQDFGGQDQPFGRHDHDQLVQAAVPSEFDASDEADDFNADDYEYVRIGGKVRAIRKASVSDEPETATQNIPKSAMAEIVDPHFYVWLADGNVIRVKQSDLPVAAGTNASYGHWQIEDKVFQIVNVYPVEDIVKGDK
jgi:hypothetical protein